MVIQKWPIYAHYSVGNWQDYKESIVNKFLCICCNVCTSVKISFLLRILRLRWLGHVVRIAEKAPSRCVFNVRICGRKRPCFRWNDTKRGNPLIDWCDRLAKACKKPRRMKGCVKAGRNSLMELLMTNTVSM